MDRRLIGTWKSDKRRTLSELRPWLDQSVKRAELMGRILGKLMIRYTRSRIHSSGIGEASNRPYQIVAKDADSVVIESPDILSGEKVLIHVHFEEGRYWVSMGAHREWFKRVN